MEEDRDLPKLKPWEAFLLTLVFAAILWVLVYFLIYNSVILAFFVAGAYIKYCHVNIPSNMKRIQRFVGKRNGMTWDEGKYYFIPVPLFDMWELESVRTFALSTACKNRSKEGHPLMILGTCIVTPRDVYLWNQVDELSREEVLLSFARQKIGEYVHRRNRKAFLNYGVHSFEAKKGKAPYGCDVQFQVNEVIDVSPETQKQFDALARMKGEENMGAVVSGIKKVFPLLSEEQRYAVYAAMHGYNPSVKTYIVKGLSGT